KEQYSGTNHNNKEQYSGINNGNPDIFIPKYFYNKNTPILRIVSRNREGLSTDLDHFTLHCMTNSILNDIINNNPSFIKNHKKKKKSKVSDKIVEWLTLCEIHGQLFQNNLENKLRTHIEERMMHLFKTHVLTHAPFHSESNYDKQERFRDDSESRGNNTRISSRTLSESREHSLKDKSRNESERNESDGNTVLINSIRYYLIHSHSIIICTLVTAGTPLLFKFSFPFVLIDESVQSTEPMSIIPLCYNIKKLILVGDHKQLGPTVVSDSKKYQQCTCCLESLDSLNDDISLCDASLGYHLNDDVSSDYHLRDHNTHHSKDHLKEHITDYSKDHLKEHITDYSKDHLKEHITDYSKDHLRNHNTHYSKDHITHYSKDHNTHSFNTPEEISKRKDSEEKNYLEEKICNTCAVRTTPLRKSLFERLLKKHVPILLTVQYRMDPLLCEFINRMFYNGRLRTSVQNNFTGLLLPKTFFYNSPFLEEQCGVSYVNKKEALVVIKLLNYLKKSGIKNDEIGIITPYEGQRNYINQLLNSQSSKMIDGYKFLHDSRNMDLYPFNKSIEDTTIEIA
ncbi:putative nonsense-mediated mRNA decay protein, partial [Pseudoloma neurophilia]